MTRQQLVKLSERIEVLAEALGVDQPQYVFQNADETKQEALARAQADPTRPIVLIRWHAVGASG